MRSIVLISYLAFAAGSVSAAPIDDLAATIEQLTQELIATQEELERVRESAEENSEDLQNELEMTREQSNESLDEVYQQLSEQNQYARYQFVADQMRNTAPRGNTFTWTVAYTSSVDDYLETENDTITMGFTYRFDQNLSAYGFVSRNFDEESQIVTLGLTGGF